MPTFTRNLTMAGRYLLLPEKFKGPKTRMSIACDGAVHLEFDAELAAEDPDHFLPVDLEHLVGQTVRLRIDGDDAVATMLDSVTSADADPMAAELGKEPLRPRFHFTAPHGWINDPNGTIYHDGQYHLFYQWNPYGTRWGNMSWGHAVSRDLVHWDHLPLAFGPDAHGAAFSGCVVHDAANSSGLGSGDGGPLVAIYSAAGAEMTQCLAYSNDCGRTWTRYAGNPVLPKLDGIGIDPMVFRHEPSVQWIMVLLAAGDHKGTAEFGFFGSQDLLNWSPLSRYRMPSSGHCPDLFPLALDGDANDLRWVLWAADGGYQVGRFDGERFEPDGPPRRAYQGRMKPRGNLYAARSFADLPDAPGRQVSLAWFSQNLPGMTFNQAMSLPVELTLVSAADGPVVRINPARELAALYGDAAERADWTVERGRHVIDGPSGGLYHVDLRATAGQGTTRFGLDVCGVPVRCDLNSGAVSCGDATWPLPAGADAGRLEVFVDRAMIEVFAGDGAVYLPYGCLLHEATPEVAVAVEDGTLAVERLTVHRMGLIWTRRGAG